MDDPRSGNRATQLLDLASRGLTDKEIALELGIQPGTVESHWKRLRIRSGHSSRSALVADWLRKKLDEQAANHAVAITSLNEYLRTITDRLKANDEAIRFADYIEYGIGAGASLVYVTDLIEPFTFRFVSQSCRFFGWTPEDFLEGRFKVFEAVHPEDIHVIWEAHKRYVEDGARAAAYFYRVQTPQFGYRWFLDRQAITAPSIYEPGHSIGLATEMSLLVESGLLEAESRSWALPAPKLPEIR